MQTGAIAVLDALGFKGIYTRFAPDAVLARLKQLAEHAQVLRKEFSTDPNWFMVSGATGVPSLLHAAFSDTVIFACLALTEAEADRQVALNRVVFASSALISDAAARGNRNDPDPIKHEPRFCYRGAITVGELAAFVGPAIDDAASQYECADAGLVHLTESASGLIADGHLIRNLLHPFNVPLKRDETMRRLCVRPLLYCRAGYRHHPIFMSQILETFDSQREDVVRKRDNTRRFLEELLNEEPLPESG
jgi:hypothetical protein